MKSLHDSAVGDFTRGGQVVIHFVRMIGQVVHQFGLAALMLYSLCAISLWFVHTEPYERYLLNRWATAEAGVALGNGATATSLQLRDGAFVQTTIGTIAAAPALHENAWHLFYMWLLGMKEAAILAGIVLSLLFAWLFKFGSAQRKDKRLRGATLVEPQELRKILRQRDLAGDLSFAGTPLVKNSETQHILLTGSSGTGKTTGMHELLTQFRQRGDRVLCYSPSGDFISWFYRPGKDVILNLFDDRSPAWDLWGECDMPYHFPMVGASLVPTPQQGEKIWAEAAQTLVAVLLETMKKKDDTSLRNLSRYVSSIPMANICEYLQGTRVANYLNPENEKMGASIRSTASIALRAIDYMREDGPAFTFKRWVEGPEDGSWVFLNARADQLDASRPVLTTMIEVFVNRVLSLTESRERRIVLAIDELASLHKINALAAFVEQARKFGGCAILGLQQFTQLSMVYGKDLGQTLTGLCNTWICYRQNDPETAEFVAKKFGKVEISESQQGLSYGANDMRDGVSLSENRKDRDVVMASEIMALPDLHGYLKMIGDLPAAKFSLRRGTIPTVAQAFVPIQIDPLAEILRIPKEDLLPFDQVEPLLGSSTKPETPKADAASADGATEGISAPTEGGSLDTRVFGTRGR